MNAFDTEFWAAINALVLAKARHPDQRIGQLISNALPRMGGSFDPFYVRDEDLADALVEYAKKLENGERDE